VNAILAVPLELRMAGLALLGVCLGGFVNWAIYALAWERRQISPWQRRDPKAPPRQWSDFLPIVGWLGLARESKIHGAGFGFRPMLIELGCGFGLAGLYWWEVTERLAPRVGMVRASQTMLHEEFVSHAVLLVLMLVATFIDFDEKTIPDEITIPGTLIGLLFAAIWPASHLPILQFIAPALKIVGYGPLLLTSPDAWSPWFNSWRGAALGIGIFVGWCLVLIPALCTLRRGWWKGIQFYFASIARDSAWWKMLLLAIVGSPAILAVWHGGGPRWQALLTSLVGLAVGGLLVWAVRIVGWVGLHKEAMGFGDVTLLAMIGSFLGWQACLLIPFFSAFLALAVALTQWVLTGLREIPFGPYLCLAALAMVIGWTEIWAFAIPYFATGLVPALASVCLTLMLGLLMLWRLIEQAVFTRR
jgi:leader peptidase (prepilin peptidase) / N-methyltransferase